MTRQELTLRWVGEWKEVWDRDDPFSLHHRVFMAPTGTLFWVGIGDLAETIPIAEEHEVLARELVGELVEIPALSHGEHHLGFDAFRASLPESAVAGLNPASIGHFLRQADDVRPGIRGQWVRFHDEWLRGKASDWLTTQGIHVHWTEFD